MNAPASRPRPNLRIHHIGLDARDALLMESSLRMRAELGDFAFGPSVPGKPVDILFVNADSSRALDKWQELRSARPELRGVVVARENPGLPDMPWIPRPISIRDCNAIVSILLETQLAAGSDGSTP